MTKTRLAVAAAAGLLLALPATAAFADYEDAVIEPVTPVPTTIAPGATLTGTVSFPTDCIPWAAGLTVDDGGEVLGTDGQNGGTEFTFEIAVPTNVEDGTEATLSVVCTYEDGIAPATSFSPAADSATAVTNASFAIPAALQTAAVYSVGVTITADAGSGSGDGSGNGTDDGGALPDTGGSNASLIAIGGALVVAGAGVTVAARRRKSAKA